MQRATRKPVLIAIGGCDPVGTGRQVELLARGLVQSGRDVHVAVTSLGGGIVDRLEAAGVSVQRVGCRPTTDVGAGLRFVRLARELEPAVVISFGRRQAELAAVARLALPAMRAVAHLAAPVRGGRLRWSLRRMDRVIATSPGVAASCSRLGISDSRIVTIAPGIAADAGQGLGREAVAARLGLDPAAEWTLCVAPLVAASRLERLLWGVDQLGVVRKGMQHVLVGTGPLLSRVRRRALVQELAERLFVFRDCNILPDLLGEVRYVWQPGSVAFGGAILDAMARGVPAVAVDGDAARQLIADGRTGWIVPPLPESEFPRRAFNLLEDDALRARFGAAAAARAAEEFPVERMVAAFAALLERLS
ncbi:MAG: glycosyltransferase family 4 protein [Planctomycetia bacterium]|nr:glycosyltransferase family 4 protein [Planctomycetia bacterium]